MIIVCGLPGSGKTTLAKEIGIRRGGVRMCADDWMDTLRISLWDEETRGRVEALQWQLAQDLLKLNQIVIIEWGTWARCERDALRTRARELGAGVELHVLDAAVDELFRRIRERNMESPPVQREDVEKWSMLFQRPTPEEMALFDNADYPSSLRLEK